MEMSFYTLRLIIRSQNRRCAGFKNVMHYCEMELQGPVLAFCDERASMKVGGCWFCEHHAAAMAQSEERWSGVNWFPLRYTESNKQLQLDDDGRFWDDEE